MVAQHEGTHRRLTLGSLVGVMVLAFLLFQLAQADTFQPPQDVTNQNVQTIRITSSGFQPAEVTVIRGSTVKWVNQDVVVHTVTSQTGLWDSGDIAPGGVYTRTFDRPGSYAYYCTFQPAMQGRVAAVVPNYVPLLARNLAPDLPTTTPGTQSTATPTPTPTPTPTSTNTPTPTPTNTPTPTPTNTPVPPPRPLFESVLRLDGADDYAYASDSADLDVGDEEGESLTVEAWFHVANPNPVPARVEVIGCKWGSYCLYIQRDSGEPDLLSFRLWRSSTSWSTWTRFLYYMSDGWHHFAGVFDNASDEIRIYYDGTLQHSGTFTETVDNSSIAVRVGGLPTANQFDGKIEEVRISDIQRYSGDTYTVPSSHFTCDGSTRALWHFDEPAGATTFFDGEDGSGNFCGSVEDSLMGQNGATTGP